MSFGNSTVLALESRRAKEMAELIRINGGVPFVAPALREVPLEQNAAAFAFADQLYAGEFEMVIFLTGVGTRLLQRVLATREPEGRFVDALRKLTVVARGPKPVAVLREWQVPIAVTVPEPNTWRELLEAIAPLCEALQMLLAGRFKVVIFTTSVQVEHLLEFAEQQGKRAEVLEALKKTFIASIGPTCSESLLAVGLTPALEPTHPKMGLLVREAALAS